MRGKAGESFQALASRTKAERWCSTPWATEDESLEYTVYCATTAAARMLFAALFFPFHKQNLLIDIV